MGALAALFATGAAASPGVPVPAGFKYMCQDHPQECRGGGAASVPLTDDLMAVLETVNTQVNRRIEPRAFEPIDIWSVDARQGDCEEYVIAKRRALINQGVPASALSYVYALRNGGGHAVLAVHTDEATLVLDNMTGKIRPLHRTGYRIVSMSGPNPVIWHRP